MPVVIYLELVANTINMVICCQSGFIFGELVVNNFSKTRIMNSVGFLACTSGITYSLFRLTYLFMGPGYVSCENLLIVGGVVLTSSTTLALIHLFIRADMINRKNNKQWKMCRVIALLFMCFNIISTVAYLLLRHVEQLPNGRCIFKLNQIALIVRYTAQSMNHIVQTLLFVYPLVSHIRNIRRQQLNDSIIDTEVYSNLTHTAFVAMMISTLYTLGLAVAVGFYKQSITIQSNIISLSIFDMALTIGCVCYASTSIVKKKKRASLTQQAIRRTSITQRRSSYTPSIDNQI